MKERADRPVQRSQSRATPPSAQAPPAVTAALALQRSAGNRAAARTLARWAKHPDAEKKGVMVPDIVAAEFMRFNPPKNE